MISLTTRFGRLPPRSFFLPSRWLFRVDLWFSMVEVHGSKANALGLLRVPCGKVFHHERLIDKLRSLRTAKSIWDKCHLVFDAWVPWCFLVPSHGRELRCPQNDVTNLIGPRVLRVLRVRSRGPAGRVSIAEKRSVGPLKRGVWVQTPMRHLRRILCTVCLHDLH